VLASLDKGRSMTRSIKKAAIRLQSDIDSTRLKITVGYTTRKPLKLIAYCRFKKDTKSVPAFVDGYPVESRHIGKIVPLG
jgi:hypothetical protein